MLETEPTAPVAGSVKAAYHDGPPEIIYYNRTWIRGVPQTIPLDDWAAMQKRADFDEFDFRVPSDQPAAAADAASIEE